MLCNDYLKPILPLTLAQIPDQVLGGKLGRIAELPQLPIIHPGHGCAASCFSAASPSSSSPCRSGIFLRSSPMMPGATGCSGWAGPDDPFYGDLPDRVGRCQQHPRFLGEFRPGPGQLQRFAFLRPGSEGSAARHHPRCHSACLHIIPDGRRYQRRAGIGVDFLGIDDQ